MNKRKNFVEFWITPQVGDTFKVVCLNLVMDYNTQLIDEEAHRLLKKYNAKSIYASGLEIVLLGEAE